MIIWGAVGGRGKEERVKEGEIALSTKLPNCIMESNNTFLKTGKSYSVSNAE